ncbi:MAG: hypothetical protein KF752_06700 [Pirellulaceae bacterium]|nr:hypothetical protein [Pirellulaceae bacterium]
MKPSKAILVMATKWQQRSASLGNAARRALQCVCGLLLYMNFLATAAGQQAGQPASAVPDTKVQSNPLSPATGQSSTPVAGETVTYGQLRELLRDLESRELKLRDQAEVQIIALGAPALQFLPAITAQMSGEMKQRLHRIRQALQQLDIHNYFQASTVTLAGNLELSKVLEQMQQQTGNQIHTSPGDVASPQLLIEVNWDRVPFWKAIQDVMDQTFMGLGPHHSSDRQVLLVPEQGPTLIEPHFFGPYRLDVQSVHTERFFASSIDGQMRVSLMLSWEPRLEPLFMRVPMQDVRAWVRSEADSGSTVKQQENDAQPNTLLLATNPDAAPEIRLNLGGCSAQFDLQFQLPDRQAQQLVRLTGQLLVSVPGGRHAYEFQKLASGGRQSQKYGDLSVTLEAFRRNGPVHEARLFVELGNPQDSLESYRNWILDSRPHLLDAQGKRLENVGFQTYSATGRGVGIAYLFQLQDDPDNCRLIYESPSSIKQQTIEYQLQHIPLP